MKQNPPECEEVSVSVTSASGRLGLRGSVRPPQVPAFPQEATVCSPNLPQLGGALSPEQPNSRGTRWPARGVCKRVMWSPSVRKLAELGISLSRKSRRGPGLAPWGPFARGAWEKTLLRLGSRVRCLSLQREESRGTVPFPAEGGGGGRACHHRGCVQKGGARAPCGRPRWPRRRVPSVCADEGTASRDFGGGSSVLKEARTRGAVAPWARSCLELRRRTLSWHRGLVLSENLTKENRSSRCGMWGLSVYPGH